MPSDPPGQSYRHPPRALVAATAVIFTGLVVQGVLARYSYWLDELYSVTMAEASLATMIAYMWLDVHPPLYQVLLRGWIVIAGSSEAASRSLSAALAIATPLTPFVARAVLPRAMLVWCSLFLAANGLLAYYGQEVRAYAMLAFLSSLAFFLFLGRRWGAMVATCAILGLVHFFGTLVAALIMVAALIDTRGRRDLLFGVLPITALICAWPTAQVLVGIGSEVAGGAFWIKTGPIESFGLAARALFAPATWPTMGLQNAQHHPSAALGFIALVALFGLLLVAWRGVRNRSDEAARAIRIAVWLIAGTTVSVAIISIHTPIATTRNFIVLLPFGAVIAANWAIRAGSKGRGIAVVWLASGLVGAVYDIRAKQAPLEDWRGAAQAAVASAARDDLPLYIATREYWDDLPLLHYLPAGHQVGEVAAGELSTLSGPAVVLFSDRACTGPGEEWVAEELASRPEDATIVLTPQGRLCGNGYVLIP